MAHGLAGRSYNGTHWTQTEEGKRKMSRALRKAAKKRKREELDAALNEAKGISGNAETHNEAQPLVLQQEGQIIRKARPRPGAEISDAEIAHTAGHVELLILLRSQSLGVSANAYAFRLLELIATKTSR
jgi:hypothetical protein